MKSDILIIGSGIAGLSSAIQIALRRPDLAITVLSKAPLLGESNTRYAQGGVATVWDIEHDTFKKHIADTLDAGDGLCDPEVVKFVVEEGPDRIREIMEWGTRFDTDSTGNFDLGREGGHSENRVLHYKDLTGWEIVRALLEKVRTLDNVTLRDNAFALDIITQHHLGYNVTRLTPDIRCFGAYVLDRDSLKVETLLARKVILAT